MSFDFGNFGTGGPGNAMSLNYLRRTAYNWHDKKPVAPLSEYEAYRDTLNPRCRALFDPRKWRRIAILRREGANMSEAARKAGFKAMPKAYAKLPDHLK